VDSVFWVISKVFWLIFSPDHLLILALLWAWLHLVLKNYRQARNWLGSTLGVALIIALLPVHDWVLYPLESRYAKPTVKIEQVDGILVLGGAEEPLISASWHTFSANDAMERLTTAVALSREYPDAKLIFSGGSGKLTQQSMKEAEWTERFWLSQGVNPERIVLESESRNTWENALNLQKMLKPMAEQEWLLVTSAYHMPRSKGIFDQLAWDVTPYPTAYLSRSAEYRPLVEADFKEHLYYLSIGVREWIGLAVYTLTGKSLWPWRLEKSAIDG
jgi:uncharacterized SAM-binding protein YcdF (DUF218 family)